MSYANWFVAGWSIILGLVMGWECWAFWQDIKGEKRYPTLSNLIAKIPNPFRSIGIVGLAILLIFHFNDVEERNRGT